MPSRPGLGLRASSSCSPSHCPQLRRRSRLTAITTRHLPELLPKIDLTQFCNGVQLLERIGHGCHGDVYHGIDCESGEHVAVKKIPTKGDGTPGSSVAPFKIDLEADLHTSVHDVASIVELKAHRRGDAVDCLLTELCRGGDLAGYLRDRGRLGEKQLRVVSRGAVEALLTCHRRGVLHGDIKAANFVIHTLRDVCLLDVDPERLDDGWLKAVDFGCSVRMGNERQQIRLSKFVRSGRSKCNCRRGTPTHWCPEVFAEKFGLAADMWCLGSMLYQLVTNRMPFFDKKEEAALRSERDILLHIIRKEVAFECSPWADYGDDAKDFISRLLRRGETERMTAEEAIQHPFIQERDDVGRVSPSDIFASMTSATKIRVIGD